MGELATKIRAKYPGAYDALSDNDLESKVVAKYPGVYDHLAAKKAPSITPQEFTKQTVADPKYRADMAQFIRSQGSRSLKQEAVRGLPMGNRLADATLGQYNNPVYAELTVDAVLGPQTQSATTGGAMVRGLGNLMANPAPQIEGAIAFPADMATGLYKAATSPERGSLAQFGKETVKGMAAPLGLADLASGDMSFPEARAAWEQNALGSGLMAYGGLKGINSGARSLKDLPAKGAEKIGLTPEKLYASSLKQSTVIPMEQRAANVKAGLEGGYVPNKKGLDRLYNDINDINTKISDSITEAATTGKAADTAPLVAELSRIDQSIAAAKAATNTALTDRAIMEHMIRNEGTQWMQKNNVSDAMYKANLRAAYEKLPPERQIQGGLPQAESINTPVVENMMVRRNQLLNEIENAAPTGKTIKVDAILERLADVKQRAIDSFGDNNPALRSIRGFEKSLKNHPSVKNGEIPIEVAQKMKVNTYKQLKNAYGELKGFEVEAKKAMARGAKEEIVAQIPELAALNAKDSTLINLEKVLFKAVNRIENRDMVGIGVPIKIATGAMGGPKGAIIGALVGLIDTPAIKANLAIAMHKARGKAVPKSELNSRLGTIKAALQARLDELREGGAIPKLQEQYGNIKDKLKDKRGLVGRDINASKPMTIEFIRNTEQSPYVGDRFGQNIEPTGKYINEKPSTFDPKQYPNMEVGSVTFQKPLVVEWGGGYAEPTNWKNVLSKKYGGRKGNALSLALKRDGYDGIVTLDKNGNTSEIVDLTQWEPRKPRKK